MPLYVVGGTQRSLRPLTAGLDWYEYHQGVIVEVDPVTGITIGRVAYETPPDACVDDDPVVLFKSSTIVGDRLYACTQTEILIFELPTFRRLHYISLPIFNDLHHVRPTSSGTLVAAISGLDMVVELTLAGRILAEYSTIPGTDPWDRFDRAVDYRKVRTTKPHLSHPNHVFFIDDELWVTRFEQRDAISLQRPGRRMEIGLERIHDGVVHGDRVYFTTVDGKVPVFDARTLDQVEVIDLSGIVGPRTLMGWARGLHFDEDGLWVGFSRIRPTKVRENVSWAMRGFKQVRPTHIAHFDLERRVCDRWFDLEPAGIAAVFSVLSTPEAAGRVSPRVVQGPVEAPSLRA